MFYLAVCNNNLSILKLHSRILILKRIRIKEYRTVFFPHSYSKLIHDTTVASVIMILRILSNQGDVLHGNFNIK